MSDGSNFATLPLEPSTLTDRDKALAAQWVRRLASSPTEVAELLEMLDIEESK